MDASINHLRFCQRIDIEVDANSRVVAAHDDEVHRLRGVEIDFLMGHAGRKINKVAGTDFRCEFQLFAPPDLAPALAYIDRDFMRPMVMGAGSPIWRKG